MIGEATKGITFATIHFVKWPPTILIRRPWSLRSSPRSFPSPYASAKWRPTPSSASRASCAVG